MNQQEREFLQFQLVLNQNKTDSMCCVGFCQEERVGNTTHCFKHGGYIDSDNQQQIDFLNFDFRFKED